MAEIFFEQQLPMDSVQESNRDSVKVAKFKHSPKIDVPAPSCYTGCSGRLAKKVAFMSKLLYRIGRALTNLGKKMGLKTQLSLTQYAESSLPTVFGEFLTTVYRDQNEEESAILISYNLTPDSCPFVRVHSECFTGEVLGSLKCDCRDQLDLAMAEIQKRGSGAIIYLRQEGRGIGLGNKIRAYHLQNQGADTIEANHQLGFDTDLRSFEAAALILRQRGIKEVVLNTNNPDKIQALTDLGIIIRERVPSLAAVNKFNEDYLKTKMKKLGHHLNGLFL